MEQKPRDYAEAAAWIVGALGYLLFIVQVILAVLLNDPPPPPRLS